MNYADRLPVIGGLIEMTKSKKGVAFIATLIILLAGGVAGVETQVLYTIAGYAVVYLTGQSFVDSKVFVQETHEKVIEAIGDKADELKATIELEA